MVKKEQNKNDKILLWVPALNSEKTIERVFDKIKKLKFNYHVLLVDNHSSDKTVSIAEEYVKKHNFSCTIIKNLKNEGYGGSNKIAWQYGMYNNFDYLIVLHSDDQYPVEYSDKLIETLKRTKSDMVLGSRITYKDINKLMPKWRIMGNKVLSAYNRWAYSLDISEFFTEFKIYDLKFMRKIDMDNLSNGVDHQFDAFLNLLKNKAKIAEISIPCSYHKDARHPSLYFTVIYVMRNLYRGLRYKLFKI